MIYLLVITLVWAFSFSFIGIYISGQVDSWFAVLMRILLALLIFIPFLRFKLFSLKQIGLLMLIGGFQLGVMYIFYYHAFNYISVPELLLFTIFTPIYITLIYDILQQHKLRVSYLFTAALAVIGTAIIRYDNISVNFWLGFFLIQGANLSFAIGQVGYKRFMELYHLPQHYSFAWVYVGAAVVATIGWLSFGNTQLLPITITQWLVLIWLGIVASGIGYFLWNYGATQVDSGTLAIMNNLVIPIGILVNVVIWQQQIDWLRFIIGATVIVISLIIQRYSKQSSFD